MQDNNQKRIYLAAAPTLVVLLLAVVQLLMPNYIHVSISFIDVFGKLLLGGSITAFALCMFTLLKMEKQMNILGVVCALLCILTALLGYFAQWWF